MKTNPQKGAYPTWSDLLAILGIYLIAMLAFNLGGGLLLRFGIASQGPVVALVYALTFLSTICYALFAKRLRVGPDVKLLRFGFRKTDPALVLWGVITVLATTLVIEPLLELFPSQWLEWLGDQMKLGGWMMLTTVVVAPILEEMVRAFCRGGDQLRAIERLIARLETGYSADTDPIPAEFRALWNTFRIALATEDTAHGE